MSKHELRQMVEAGFDQVSRRLDLIEAEQRRQGKALAELKGDLRGLHLAGGPKPVAPGSAA